MIPIVGTALLAEIGKHHAQLAELYAKLSEVDWDGRGDLPERVLGLREAAVRLGVTRSWLSRRPNWTSVGGYLGPDRRVKFADSALRRYLDGAASGGDR